MGFGCGERVLTVRQKLVMGCKHREKTMQPWHRTSGAGVLAFWGYTGRLIWR